MWELGNEALISGNFRDESVDLKIKQVSV